MKLSLTKDQAQFLIDVLSHIGGCPEFSRRKYSDNLVKRLEKQGYEGDVRKDMSGNIYFDNI